MTYDPATGSASRGQEYQVCFPPLGRLSVSRRGKHQLQEDRTVTVSFCRAFSRSFLAYYHLHVPKEKAFQIRGWPLLSRLYISSVCYL